MRYCAAVCIGHKLSFTKVKKVVKNKIREVTVFFKGAQVFRAGEVKVNKGTTKIVFSGVSPLINPKSMQVSSSGAVDILDVKHRVVHPDPNLIVDEALPSSILNSILKYSIYLLYKSIYKCNYYYIDKIGIYIYYFLIFIK